MKQTEFENALTEFVTDDETALQALKALHARVAVLAGPIDAKQRLFYLESDLDDLISNTNAGWKNNGEPWTAERAA